MRLLAALAAISTFAIFAVVSTTAHAQVYPPPTFSLVCETGVQFIVDPSAGQQVTVTVFDTANQPVPNAEVTFVSSQGSVDPSTATTNASGEATTTLDPEGFVGDITVTANLTDNTSCQTEFEQEVLSSTIEEVASLPATGSGGVSGGSAMPWALVTVGVLAFVVLAGRKITDR